MTDLYNCCNRCIQIFIKSVWKVIFIKMWEIFSICNDQMKHKPSRGGELLCSLTNGLLWHVSCLLTWHCLHHGCTLLRCVRWLGKTRRHHATIHGFHHARLLSWHCSIVITRHTCWFKSKSNNINWNQDNFCGKWILQYVSNINCSKDNFCDQCKS